jgi:hypothetical protein
MTYFRRNIKINMRTSRRIYVLQSKINSTTRNYSNKPVVFIYMLSGRWWGVNSTSLCCKCKLFLMWLDNICIIDVCLTGIEMVTIASKHVGHVVVQNVWLEVDPDLWIYKSTVLGSPMWHRTLCSTSQSQESRESVLRVAEPTTPIAAKRPMTPSTLQHKIPL